MTHDTGEMNICAKRGSPMPIYRVDGRYVCAGCGDPVRPPVITTPTPKETQPCTTPKDSP